MVSNMENSTVSKNEARGNSLDLFLGNGPWQRLIFLASFICFIPFTYHNLAMTFIAPNVDHWCSRPPDVNITIDEWKLTALPKEDTKCSRYKFVHTLNSTITYANFTTGRRNITSHTIVSCESWEYDHSVYSSSIVNKWDLVCDQAWLVSLSKSIFMIGYLCSVTITGGLADKYGRKPVIVVCGVIAFFSSVICAFSTSFLMFAALRLLIAVGTSGVFNTVFVLLMEVVSPAHRPLYGLSINFGWCLGFVSLPLIAWLLRDWFWIQIFITIPTAFLLGTYWFFPESPRWLIAKGKYEEAKVILIKAGKMNGMEKVELETKIKEIITDKGNDEKENQRGNLLDLIKTPGLRGKTINLFYLWCVIAFMYYGLSYNTNEQEGDPFLNFAASGAIEFPANFISIFIIKSFGRRTPLSMFLILGAVACFLMYPIPTEPWWLPVVVSMTGKFCLSCAFGIIYVYTAELFPTVVRNVGMGSASVSARIGSILSPFVRELGYATHPAVPQVIYGILATIGGLLVLLLPETNNCHVPDTLEEAAKFSK
ncbi:organic cation transporter protein isoform X2 [Parasteatoda tepidariorum]|nr:organic cation transporter protein-like isoform X1 [Parasteatoda tepidariorum]XP_042898839.1 organic cation transporter protein-like isoform X1 [Parasteatoda tepidariorum]XP_042898841.1 organic cation transporter protein-like isoform X1 [Parasteatoda tepidariorum]